MAQQNKNNEKGKSATAAPMLVATTAPNAAVAAALAEHLVGKRLAACVSILPACLSIYRWAGKIARDEEVLLLIKTTRASEATAAIKTQHPYEVPEVICFAIDSGLPAYLNWMREECAPQ